MSDEELWIVDNAFNSSVTDTTANRYEKSWKQWVKFLEVKHPDQNSFVYMENLVMLKDRETL